jgi:hypothetical protein
MRLHTVGCLHASSSDGSTPIYLRLHMVGCLHASYSAGSPPIDRQHHLLIKNERTRARRSAGAPAAGAPTFHRGTAPFRLGP